MKLILSILVVALAATCYGRRSGPRPHQEIDLERIMYEAGGTVQCDLCEMVVTDVQSLLKGREPEIQNFLDSLCSDLPTAYQFNCTSIVDTYLPVLFALIDDMTPAEVCEILTLCTGEEELPKVRGRQTMQSFISYFMQRVSMIKSLKQRRIDYFRSAVGEDYLCEACEDCIGFIHEAVACNYTWAAVQRFFEPLCEIWPYGRGREACENFFNELPGDVNAFADEYLDPGKDCGILGFCPEDEEIEYEIVEMVVEVEEPEKEEEVTLAVPIQPRSRTGVDVNRRLYKLDAAKIKKMNKLGKKGKKHGQMGLQSLNTFRRRLTRAIHTVYAVGGREDVNETPVLYDVSDPAVQEVPAQKKCEVCRYFSSAVEGVIQYNQEDITNALTIVFEDICDALPSQFQDECTTGIEEVLPVVIYQAALKIFNPEYLCTEMIGICQ